MKCSNCNTEFLKDIEVCPVCGNKLRSIVTDTKAEPSKEVPRKKKPFIVYAVLAIVAVFVVAILIDNAKKPNTQLQEALESTAQTPQELYDRLDFSALLVTLDNYSHTINNAFICDSDNDGHVELFAATTPKEVYGKNTVFSFETADAPGMSSTTQNGAAGEASLKKVYSAKPNTLFL